MTFRQSKQQQPSGIHQYVLIDYDKTLVGMTSAGLSKWIQPTLDYIQIRAKDDNPQFIIFTSMDMSVVRSEYTSDMSGQSTYSTELKNNPNGETATKGFDQSRRPEGVKKIKEIRDANAKQKSPSDVLVLTPIDGLSQTAIGNGYKQYKYVYEEIPKLYDQKTMQVDFKKLEADKKYVDLLLDENYLTRIDRLIGYIIEQKGGGYMKLDANIFAPIKVIAAQYINNLELLENIGSCVENITTNISGTPKPDEANKHFTKLFEHLGIVGNDKLIHLAKLLFIHANYTKPEDLKSAFETFVSLNQNVPYIQTSKKIYDNVKDHSSEKYEKFLMCLHMIDEAVKKAKPGDTIEIEYLDDKKECLQEMHDALNFYMKKNNKPITIDLKTIEVISEKNGAYKHQEYKHEQVSSSLDQSLLSIINKSKKIYQLSEHVLGRHASDLENIQKEIDFNLHTLNDEISRSKEIVSILEKAFNKEVNKYCKAFISKKDPEGYGTFLNNKTDRHHYARLLGIILSEVSNKCPDIKLDLQTTKALSQFDLGKNKSLYKDQLPSVFFHLANAPTMSNKVESKHH